MANLIGQYRWFSDKSKLNSGDSNMVIKQPDGVVDYSFKSYFENKIIKQLSIQTMPGVKFFLNEYKEPVMVGATGIFELDITAGTEIYFLRFHSKSIEAIERLDNAYVIVDIVYEEGGE